MLLFKICTEQSPEENTKLFQSVIVRSHTHFCTGTVFLVPMKSVDGKMQKQSDSDEELLRQEMECPVCFCTQFSPVRQCPNGHTLCDDCSKHSACKKCPTCRAAPTSIRCLGNLTLSLSLMLSVLNVSSSSLFLLTPLMHEPNHTTSVVVLKTF